MADNTEEKKNVQTEEQVIFHVIFREKQKEKTYFWVTIRTSQWTLIPAFASMLHQEG